MYGISEIVSNSNHDFPLRLLSGPNGTPTSGDLFLDTEYHVEMMTKRREREHRYKTTRLQQNTHLNPNQIPSWEPQDNSVESFIPTSVSFAPSDQVNCYSSTSPTVFDAFESNDGFLNLPNNVSSLCSISIVVLFFSNYNSAIGRKKQKKKKSKSRHSAISSVAGVCVPSRNDVLFGRGKRLQNHQGNGRFRMLIDGCLDSYDTAS
jgi:hypothetical protein